MANTFVRVAIYILCFYTQHSHAHLCLHKINLKTLELLWNYFNYYYWVYLHSFEENSLSLKIQKKCADLCNDSLLELDFFNKLLNEFQLNRRKEYIALFKNNPKHAPTILYKIHIVSFSSLIYERWILCTLS